MYFVFILLPVFCAIFSSVEGGDDSEDETPGKDKSFALTVDGTVDLASLLGQFFGDDSGDPHHNLRKKKNNNAAIRINTMTTSLDTGMTQIEEIATSTHKVKDSKMVHEFTLYAYKQAMKLFDKIKQKTKSKDVKEKVGTLAKSYQSKFVDFVQITREYDVRTGLGDQKAILNILDTSILILQRLVNFLKGDYNAAVDNENEGEGDAEQENVELSSDDLQKEVDFEKESEYDYVCKQYGYCRSAFGLKTVLQNIVKILASAPNNRLIKGIDAITEVLKGADFSRIIDSRSEITFKDKLSRFEKTSPEQARLAINILLDAISNLNAPIEVAPEHSGIAQKTTAFYNILNELDSAIPADDRNRMEWAAVQKDLQEWVDGKREDVQGILQSLLSNITRGIKTMQAESAIKIRNQLNIH